MPEGIHVRGRRRGCHSLRSRAVRARQGLSVMHCVPSGACIFILGDYIVHVMPKRLFPAAFQRLEL